ncbi:hypothetical protein [Rummeliibacillus stabekisii]|uniref:hypothetical protein n=1 Tax=Rummeliibacillus stabekisii TaxID=241244 RepID=UPI0037204961
MREALTTILIAIVPAMLSYFAATYKSRKELEIVKMQNQNELDRIERQSKAEVEKLERELEAQAKLYESNAQTDIAKDLMMNPKQLMEMLEIIESPTFKKLMK